MLTQALPGAMTQQFGLLLQDLRETTMEAVFKVKNQALMIGVITPLIVISFIENDVAPWLIMVTFFVAVARLSWLYRHWQPE